MEKHVYLHGPPFLNKRWLDFILQVVNLLSEVHLRGPRLNTELLTERDPFTCKF